MSTEQTADHREGLSSVSYIALLLTQFLGTINDNMFRWFAVCLAQPVIGNEEALSIGLAAFTVPYILLAVPAGYLADRYSKRTIIVACKWAEIVIMSLGLGGVLLGNAWYLLLVVALMGSQSALFGPSKYGAIPELVRSTALSKANGLMGLTTVAASAIGAVAGYALYGAILPAGDETFVVLKNPPSLSGLMIPALALLGVAGAGVLTSLPIRKLAPANPARVLDLNLYRTVRNDMRVLTSSKSLRRTALGIAFFWMLASLAQTNIDPFGDAVLGLDKQTISVLLAVLVVGLGFGSVLAGVISGDKVELGLVPLGAAGIAISSMLLFVSGNMVDPSVASPTAQPAFILTCVFLFFLGIASGFFDIPLEANLQRRSDPDKVGTVLAATNFLTFAFILASAGLFWVMKKGLGLSPDQIFLVAGLGTVPVVWYAFQLLPQATIRFVVWVGSHLFYRVRVIGRQHIPERGGALLVANHVSWLDGVLLLMISDRPIRMLAYAAYVEKGPAGWLARTFGVIPINVSAGPKALIRSLQTAKEAAANGELVCIFAEGGLTRTGQLQPFQRGLLRIVEGSGVPVIPTYLDQLWGSIFSYHGGKFFWKRPRKWPYPITILFGEPLHDPDDVNEVREAVELLGVKAVEHRHSTMIPAQQFLRASRRARNRGKVADSSGLQLTGGRLLTGALCFRRVLNRQFLQPDEQMVGVLLPPSAGGALVNASLALMGRTSVNLNYTLTTETLNYCIREAGIRHVITSKTFLEKKPMTLDAEWILVEDVKAAITGTDKALSAAAALLEPVWLMERRLGLTRINPDDPMTIIFTSGSTGEPKGVMLSHRNIGSNIASADQLFQIKETDVLLGILPFFHSFGFSLMLWLPLTLDPKGVYHFNPLDGRTIGQLCGDHKVTIIAATPTFLKTYLKRCTKEQMAHVDLAIVGAEKLPQALAEEFKAAFGIYPTEGYGTTELSPLAAANVPDHRSNAEGTGQTGSKPGTVGRPVPNVAAKVIDPDSGVDLGLNKPGLLLIKGPNVMLGYLNRPEKTAEVIRDGWYNTGDIAVIDNDGFISITGRLSRFSKIGGEMVPHIRIEEELNRIIGDSGSEDAQVHVAVTAIPDESRGERLIVLHRPLSKPVDQILNELSAAGLPNLWLPGTDSFLEVEQIPLLGTGKLDLKGIKDLALARFGKP